MKQRRHRLAIRVWHWHARTALSPPDLRNDYKLVRIFLFAYAEDMEGAWRIAVSAEVADWYRKLKPADRRLTDKMLDKLRSMGNPLRMQHSRSLGDGLFELRFSIQQATVDQRITYMFRPEQRIITLTAFRKTKNNERQEVARARQAKDDYEKEDKS